MIYLLTYAKPNQVFMTCASQFIYTSSKPNYFIQVHPNTLCGMRPMLTFGNIYILKLEKRASYASYGSFCASAAEKVSSPL